MNASEPREHPRFALEVDASIDVGDRQIPVRTRDLSRGGLCFVATSPVAAGAEVRMTLALVFDEATFSESLAVRARVVWCTPLAEGQYQLGTCFLGLTADNRTYLDLFLRYLKEGSRALPTDADAASSEDDDEDKRFG
jgi:hypothetical protein